MTVSAVSMANPLMAGASSVPRHDPEARHLGLESGPAELAQLSVRDSEVMPDFVNDGHSDPVP